MANKACELFENGEATGLCGVMTDSYLADVNKAIADSGKNSEWRFKE